MVIASSLTPFNFFYQGEYQVDLESLMRSKNPPTLLNLWTWYSGGSGKNFKRFRIIIIPVVRVYERNCSEIDPLSCTLHLRELLRY